MAGTWVSALLGLVSKFARCQYRLDENSSDGLLNRENFFFYYLTTKVSLQFSFPPTTKCFK